MTLNEYKLYALTKKQIEYHSFNPNAVFQCVDLANDYIVKVWGLKAIIGTDAKDFPERLTPGMEFIKNTVDYLPEAGEVAVWSGKVGGGAGHISVVLKKGLQTTFQSLDQNWSKPLFITDEKHSYTNVRGFLWSGKVGGSAGHISVVLKKGLQTTFQSLDQNWSKPLFITEEKHSYTNVRGFLRKKESMPLADPLKECLSQHAKLVAEATKKETEIKGLKTSLEENSGQITTQEVEIATLGKQVSAYKGEVTKKENEIIELNKKLTEKPSGFFVGKRKMLVGILTPIVVAIVKIFSTKLGVELDAQEMLYLILAGLAYIGVEGVKDLTVAVKSIENTDTATK